MDCLQSSALRRAVASGNRRWPGESSAQILDKHILLTVLGTVRTSIQMQMNFFFFYFSFSISFESAFCFLKCFTCKFLRRSAWFLLNKWNWAQTIFMSVKILHSVPPFSTQLYLFRRFFYVMANAVRGVSVLSFPINCSFNKTADLLLVLKQGRVYNKAWICRQSFLSQQRYTFTRGVHNFNAEQVSHHCTQQRSERILLTAVPR